MPLIQVTLIEGRTAEQKQDFVQRVTQAAADALGSAPETVRIVLQEIDPDNWIVAGETMTQRRARTVS